MGSGEGGADARAGFGPPQSEAARATAPREVRLAAAVMVGQAAGLAGAGLVVVAKTLAGSADSLGRAASDAGFALGGALLLVLAARALVHLRSAARTPVVVLQLLALPVGYSLGVQAGRIAYGGPVLLSALCVLFLLFTPAARRVLDR